MAKFVKAAFKKDMIRVAVDGQEKWATCTPQVLGFVKKTFKGGEDVEYQSDITGELGFHITRISKVGEKSPEPKKEDKVAEFVCEVCGKSLKDDKYKKCYTCNQNKSTISDKPKCQDCGKELKDDKYKKCYECNKKNPVKSGGSYNKSPEVQDSIKRQAIGHMTSRSLIALQGQVDPNNITGLMEVLYKKYQELVG